jgi:mannosyltransferase OCH1-like enzyme
MPDNCSPLSFIEFLKKLYNQNHLLKSNKPKIQIPKIIHQIWLGEGFPTEYKIFQDNWKKQHPDWRFIFWTEQKLKEKFPNFLYNQKLFNEAHENENFAKMADIARYEILYKFGGLYADCDCDCLKPFDILNENYSFYVGLEHLYNGLVIGNALMGAIPKHPVIKQCLINIKQYENKKIEYLPKQCYSKHYNKLQKRYLITIERC